jgi:hypothetical protein
MPDKVNHFSPQSKTQSAAILRLLVEARGAWVPLPDIMACAAQYNARIFSLRRDGYNIENRTETVNGVRHSWFRLVDSPAVPAIAPSKPSQNWAERKPITGLPLWDSQP